MSNKPQYDLTGDQDKFVTEAEGQGLTVDYEYVGKFNFGRKCPAVKVQNLRELRTSAKNAQWEHVAGSHYIIYCPY